MNNFKNVKIKINSHKEFLKATKLLIKSGFVWGGNGAVPVTAPYLYTYDDGTMLVVSVKEFQLIAHQLRLNSHIQSHLPLESYWQPH